MELKELQIPLERDIFLRSLVRELSGVLEDVVGIKEASGFVSVVGQSIGKSQKAYSGTILRDRGR
jgi:hypothetical protein